MNSEADSREPPSPASFLPTRPAARAREQPAAEPVSTPVMVSVAHTRFSQNTVSGTTYLHGTKVSMEQLVASMRSRGYSSAPIDVVRLPNGELTSLDNRRLLAARRAGLEEIPAVIHDGSERLPADERGRFRVRKSLECPGPARSKSPG